MLYRFLPHPPARAATGSGPRSRCGWERSSAARSGRSCSASSSWRSRSELADAARVDGANPWHIYRYIYLPLAKPALATLAIFTFMWTWNDLIDPIIYLRDIESLTLTAGLSLFQGQYVGTWPLLMAGALVSVIPMILLFVIAQRQFVRGIAMTGIKG